MTAAVAYCRVSTEFQRETGYSLDGQRAMIRRYAEERGFHLIEEFREAESGYKAARITLDTRPALSAALDLCRKRRATLIIAALDRLARNVVFVATLVETRIPFVALDIPDATPFMIHIYAAMAEEESRQKGRLISAARALARQQGRLTHLERTARARAYAIRPTIDEILASGIHGAVPIAREMARRGILSERRRPWSVGRVGYALQLLGHHSPDTAKRNQLDAEERERKLLPLIARLRSEGLNMSEVAVELSRRGITTGRGHRWTGGRLWNFVRSRQRRARKIESLRRDLPSA